MFQLFGVHCTLKDKCGQEKSSKADAVCLYFALDSPFFCCDIDPDASVRELAVGNHAPEIEVTSRIRNTASETENRKPDRSSRFGSITAESSAVPSRAYFSQGLGFQAGSFCTAALQHCESLAVIQPNSGWGFTADGGYSSGWRLRLQCYEAETSKSKGTALCTLLA